MYTFHIGSFVSRPLNCKKASPFFKAESPSKRRGSKRLAEIHAREIAAWRCLEKQRVEEAAEKQKEEEKRRQEKESKRQQQLELKQKEAAEKQYQQQLQRMGEDISKKQREKEENVCMQYQQLALAVVEPKKRAAEVQQELILRKEEVHRRQLGTTTSTELDRSQNHSYGREMEVYHPETKRCGPSDAVQIESTSLVQMREKAQKREHKASRKDDSMMDSLSLSFSAQMFDGLLRDVRAETEGKMMQNEMPAFLKRLQDTEVKHVEKMMQHKQNAVLHQQSVRHREEEARLAAELRQQLISKCRYVKNEGRRNAQPCTEDAIYPHSFCKACYQLYLKRKNKQH